MEEPVSKSQSLARPFVAVVIAALVVLSALVGYSLHQHSLAKRLAADNQTLTSTLAQTQSQVQSLADKVNTLSAPPQPQAQALPAAGAVSAPRPRRVMVRRRADDPRWKKFQTQLDEQGKAIEATRTDLSAALDSTKSELSGSIARTHDELVLLQKKGERAYYEFDLIKTGQFQRSGPFAIKLKKANTKNQYADLELMVDDVKLTQKHVNLYQPVMFYSAEGGRPVELVINSVSKNRIHGYVSEPRYKQSELAAAPAADASGQPAATATDRKKLPFPK